MASNQIDNILKGDGIQLYMMSDHSGQQCDNDHYSVMAEAWRGSVLEN
jgi:hypothetical protein